MELDTLGFSPTFQCHVIRSNCVHRSDELRFAPSHVDQSTTVGMVVEVVPSVEARWIGWFESDVDNALSGVFACPSEDDLLVVSGGNGYLVSAAHPDTFELLPRLIQGVGRVPEMPLMIVWDEQDITLYGRSGVIWWVERVAEEGMRITAVTPSSIVACVPNFSTGKEQLISIDVVTGHVDGAWLRYGPADAVYPRTHHTQSRE